MSSLALRIGLGVIASMMGIFNFAHGEFVLLGAYTVYMSEKLGLPAWAGMTAAPFVVALIGLLLERVAIQRFYATPVIAMLGTYAIGMALREGVRTLLGGQFYGNTEQVPRCVVVERDANGWSER